MKRCPVCKTVYPDDANFCPMDASTLDDEPAAPGVQASLDLPTMMAKLVGGRFRLGPQIGGRRTGEVFSAEDITNGAAVAVKLVSPAVFPTPLVAQRTERELKQLMKVTSDRVTRVLDVGKQGDRLYVALELVSGVTLAELVATNGPLPIDQAVRLSLEVGEALAEAAKLGVIHRDVSPKNVLVVADERVASGRRIKLINFGVPTPSSDHKVHGTPEFLSPSRRRASRSISDRTSTASARCCISCSRARRRSPATRPRCCATRRRPARCRRRRRCKASPPRSSG
jgi:serine/threonine-protein kinase